MVRLLRILGSNKGKGSPSSPGAATAVNQCATGPFTTPAEKAAENDRYGMKVLVDQKESMQDAVDIVAIHGLDGHRENTWTDPDTLINWLSDPSCLPRDIPQARISSFGYNSSSYFSRSDADIRDFASELLAALEACRSHSAEAQRPIVFLCHSLGGLVFKQAMIRAHEQDRFYKSILDKVQGVVFFGVPHRGSALATWNDIGTLVVRAALLGYAANNRIMKNLKVNAQILKDISDSFAYRGWSINIRSFYETKFMPGLNCRVVERDSAVLGWGNELPISSNSDHRSICKFYSAEDPRYKAVVKAVRDVFTTGGPGEPDTRPFTSREEKCMMALNSDYLNHLGVVDDAVPGTCEWVLHHEQWRKWDECQGTALLWVTSNAGCGKSVLAKFLVNRLSKSIPGARRGHVGYFFFVDGIERQANAALAVSALLHQLYSFKHHLVSHAMEKYEVVSPKVFSNLSTLWSIFTASLDAIDADQFTFILDGLDESHEQSLQYLIRALARLLNHQGSLNNYATAAATTEGSRIKFVLLSRPNSIMQQTLGLYVGKDNAEAESSNKFRLIGENESEALEHDIRLFAKSQIGRLGLATEFPQEVMTSVENMAISNADYTFLWISLVMTLISDSANNGTSVIEVTRILSTATLDDLYRKLLEEICVAQANKARKLLLLVLAAVRPLTVDELCVAVEVDESNTSGEKASGVAAVVSEAAPVTHLTPQVLPEGWADGEETAKSKQQTLQTLRKQLHRPFDNHIRKICGHFLRIRCGKIYLVHQTARIFLQNASFALENNGACIWLTRPEVMATSPVSDTDCYRWHSITDTEAHKFMLQVCVSYITMISSAQEYNHGKDSCNKEEDDLGIRGENDVLAFYQYAATHWIQHYRPLRTLLNQAYDYLLQPHSSLCKTWIRVHQSWTDQANAAEWYPNGLHIPAARSGQWQTSDDSWMFCKDNNLQRKLAYPRRQCHGIIKSIQIAMRANIRLPESIYDDAIALRESLTDLDLLFQSPEPSADHLASTEAKIRAIQTPLDDLEERRDQLLKESPNRQLLWRMEQTRDWINNEARLQSERTEQLHEVLMHFGLFRPAEAGLEEDEFLEGYFQAEDAEPGQGPAKHAPDWVRHHFRQMRRIANARVAVSGTPGADLPGLSNPLASASGGSKYPWLSEERWRGV